MEDSIPVVTCDNNEDNSSNKTDHNTSSENKNGTDDINIVNLNDESFSEQITVLANSSTIPLTMKQNSKKCDTICVKDLLKNDLYSCDMLWCLFIAAAKSYRFSSILRPFPAMYQEGEEKNMFGLKSAIASIPKLSIVASSWSELGSENQELLSWLFGAVHFKLKLKEKESFKMVKDLTGQITKTPEPSYVFEVVYSQEAEAKFENLRNERDCFYAYHGSRLDNFFSIINNGLNTHMNKVAVFGEGTYLSSELSVSLLYSPAAEVTKTSMLGARLGCVAVCQMIDDPSVKCQVKDGTSANIRNRAQASKETDAVPEKYYVVQRNDILRVKYLLVYKEESSQAGSHTGTPSWLWEHKFLVLMLAYIVLLVAIGVSNNRPAMLYLRRLWKGRP